MDPQFELAIALSLTLKIGGSILKEAENALGPEWTAELRSRLNTEIKNTILEGFPSFKDEAALYETALSLCNGIFVYAGHKSNRD